MEKKWLAVMIPGILGLIIIAFFVSLLLVKLLWAWTVPDLFPGAVQQGLIAKEISWLAAFKIAIFISVLSGLVKINAQTKE